METLMSMAKADMSEAMATAERLSDRPRYRLAIFPAIPKSPATGGPRARLVKSTAAGVTKEAPARMRNAAAKPKSGMPPTGG